MNRKARAETARILSAPTCGSPSRMALDMLLQLGSAIATTQTMELGDAADTIKRLNQIGARVARRSSS